MTDVKWIKITTSMFDDEKIDFIESLPESDAIIVIWVKLLTLAGKCNANGYIFLTENIPYTDEMLAHKFRRKVNVVQMALDTLRRLGMIEDLDGKIKITNWEKHQNIEGLDKIREQTKLRVQKHREKQKLLPECNVTSNATVTQSNAPELELDKKKNKKKKELPKKQYAEFVTLTEKEYDRLVERFSKPFADKCIETLDNAKGANGYKYKSDYRAILNWVTKRVEEELGKQKQEVRPYQTTDMSELDRRLGND